MGDQVQFAYKETTKTRPMKRYIFVYHEQDNRSTTVQYCDKIILMYLLSEKWL